MKALACCEGTAAVLTSICLKYTEHRPNAPLGISQSSQEKHTHAVMLYTAIMQFLAAVRSDGNRDLKKLHLLRKKSA